jgi:hypothetical protein
MRSRTPRPPRLARMLVRLRGRSAAGDQAESDLLELFETRMDERGAGYARRAYWRDALSLWVHRSPLTRPMKGRPTAPPFAGASQTTAWSLDTMWHDIVFAGRLYRREPAIVALTIAGLALAIGVATAVFSILNAAALRPIGVADPDATVSVWRTWRNGASTSWPYADYLLARDSARLSTLEGWLRETAPLGLAPGDDTTGSSPVHLVSGGYFSTFGGRTARGRGLIPDDDRPGAPLVTVVNHAFWRQRLGADRSSLAARSTSSASRPRSSASLNEASPARPSRPRHSGFRSRPRRPCGPIWVRTIQPARRGSR